MREMTPLLTFVEAASELGTSVCVIRGLVAAHRIETLRVPRSPRGRGLTTDHMAILRRALGKEPAGKGPRRKTAKAR